MAKRKFTYVKLKTSINSDGNQQNNSSQNSFLTSKLTPSLRQAELNTSSSNPLMNSPFHSTDNQVSNRLDKDNTHSGLTETNSSRIRQTGMKTKLGKSSPVNYFQRNSFEPTRIEYPQESLQEMPLFSVGEPKMVDYSVDTESSKQKNMIPMFQLVVYQTRKEFERSNQLGMLSDPHRTILSHICPPFAIGLNQVVDYASGLLSTHNNEILGQIRQYIDQDNNVGKQLSYVYNIIRLAIDKLERQPSTSLKTSMKDRGGYDHITILSPATLENMINHSENVMQLSKKTQMIPHSWYIENYSQLANIYLELLFQLHSNNLAFKENADQELIEKYLNGTITLPYNAAGTESQNVLIQIIQKFTPSLQEDLKNLQASNTDVIGVINAWTASYKLSLEQINNYQNAKTEAFNRQAMEVIGKKTTTNIAPIQNVIMNYCKKILKFGVDGRQNEQENIQPTNDSSASAQAQNLLKQTTSLALHQSSNTPVALANKNPNRQNGTFVTHVTNERLLASRSYSRCN